MTRLDTLDKIHPDLISAFLTTGKCDGIPADVQLFLKQLQWAAEIYEYERNITRAAKQLRQRINAQQQINVDERTCKARILCGHQLLQYRQQCVHQGVGVQLCRQVRGSCQTMCGCR